MVEDPAGEYVRIDDITSVLIYEVDEVHDGMVYGLLRQTDGKPTFTLQIPLEEMKTDQTVEPGSTFVCVLNKESEEYTFKRRLTSYCHWTAAQIAEIKEEAREMSLRLMKQRDSV